MENYYLYEVVPPLINFIDELTNWYVRSNRKRFWKEKGVDDKDKINAFKTLHEVLLEFSKTMAPVLPFICEEIYQGLVEEENTSIHYENYPVANENLINKNLENEILIAKNIIKASRNIRLKVEIPNKQPLNSLSIITADVELQRKIRNVEQLILNELNVKKIIFEENVSEWIKYDCKPNYQVLGPKLGKKINELKKELNTKSQDDVTDLIEKGFFLFHGEKISVDDLDLQLVAVNEIDNQDIVGDYLISLNTNVDNELLEERLSREVVSLVQKKRKDSGYDITDRISTIVYSRDKLLLSAIQKHEKYIMNETLSVDFKAIDEPGSESLLDYSLTIELSKS
jgi:isoleucyl-tRNA synthetase